MKERLAFVEALMEAGKNALRATQELEGAEKEAELDLTELSILDLMLAEISTKSAALFLRRARYVYGISNDEQIAGVEKKLGITEDRIAHIRKSLELTARDVWANVLPGQGIRARRVMAKTQEQRYHLSLVECWVIQWTVDVLAAGEPDTDEEKTLISRIITDAIDWETHIPDHVRPRFTDNLTRLVLVVMNGGNIEGMEDIV